MKSSRQHHSVEGWRGERIAEMQMLTIAVEGSYITRFSFPELLLPTCLSVREREGACSEGFLQDEETPAVVKQVLAVPDTSWPVPCGGSGGGGSLLC